MSTILVDTINEKTSGNGIQIPGHVVQVKAFATSSQITTSATNVYVTLLSGAITTLYANSIIVVQGVVQFYSNNPSAGIWTNSAYVQLQENSTTVAGYEHPGPHTSMEFSNCVPVLFNSGQKSVGTYTYGIQSRPTTGGDTHYFGRNTNGGGGNAYSYTRMTLMEIAQ